MFLFKNVWFCVTSNFAIFFFCFLFIVCGARYKTRPGLTYHYTHSHKEKPQDDENSLEGAPVSPNSQKDKLQQQSSVPGSKDMLSSPMPGPGIGMNPNAMHPSSAHPYANQAGPGGWGKFQDSYLTFLGGSPGMCIYLCSIRLMLNYRIIFKDQQKDYLEIKNFTSFFKRICDHISFRFLFLLLSFECFLCFIINIYSISKILELLIYSRNNF